jgi:hypothetical protein
MDGLRRKYAASRIQLTRHAVNTCYGCEVHEYMWLPFIPSDLKRVTSSPRTLWAMKVQRIPITGTTSSHCIG